MPCVIGNHQSLMCAHGCSYASRSVPRVVMLGIG